MPRSGSSDVSKGDDEFGSGVSADAFITPVDLVCRICEERVRADLLEGHTEFCMQCIQCREGGELSVRVSALHSIVRERMAEGKDLRNDSDRLPVS